MGKAELYKSKALDYQEEGSYSLALSFYKQALEAGADASEIWLEMGFCFYSMQDYQRALEASRQALSFDSGMELAWYNAAISCKQMERYEEALGYLNRSLEIYPQYLYARISRAQIHFIQEDWHSSLQDYTDCLNHPSLCHDQTLHCLCQRGKIYINLNALDFAIQDFTRVLRKKPSHLEALKKRAYTYYLQEELEMALVDLNHSISIKEDMDLKFLRGAIYLKMNRNNEACQDFLSMGS